MRHVTRPPHTQKIRPLVHRQRQQPPNLVDECPLTLFLESVFRGLLYLLKCHIEYLTSIYIAVTYRTTTFTRVSHYNTLFPEEGRVVAGSPRGESEESPGTAGQGGG